MFPPQQPYYHQYDYNQQSPQQSYYQPPPPYYQPPPPFFQPQQTQQPEPQTESPQPDSSNQRPGKGHQQSPRKRRDHRKKSDSGPKTCNKRNWAGLEEAWLATCWCDTSEDPITGIDQKKGQLWATVEEKFNANDEGWVRNADALSSKMRYINNYCKAFNDIYEAQNSLAKRGSGNDNEQVYDRSVQEYFRIHKRSWNMKEAWKVVKDHPKWRKIAGVQRDYEDYADSIDLSDDRPTHPFTNELFQDDPIPRPIGRDRAKKIARSSGSSDAGSASRASTGSGKSKLEEIAECMTDRNAQIFEARKKALEDFTYNENLRTAMQGLQVLNADTSGMGPKALRVHNKVCKKLMERFGHLYGDSDEEEGGDGDGEDGGDSDE